MRREGGVKVNTARGLKPPISQTSVQADLWELLGGGNEFKLKGVFESMSLSVFTIGWRQDLVESISQFS